MSTRDAWRKIAARYERLSTDRAAEGPSIQLACLVLAEYCEHLWMGNGGPSLAMVAIAEHLLGDRLDAVVAAELAKVAAAREGDRERSLS